MPLLQGVMVAQRAMQPATQQPSTHGGRGVVKHADQGVCAVSGGRFFQFQVAARGSIQYQAVVTIFNTQAIEVRQGRALGVFYILQQAARGTDGGIQCLAAEAAEVMGRRIVR